jgi:hypothetical protein
MAAMMMANKTIPEMSGFWKKSTITEAYRLTYHSTSWLSGGLESLVPEVDVPTLDSYTVVCFDSHLVARLDLPPSKFFVAIMNFLGCELVDLKLNTIAALSYFTMLCECWFGITLDTSLFWYLYSPSCYGKVIYSRIGLSLCCNRQKDYIDATFKSSWRGSSRMWFLVDMHVPPQWVNRHLLPPLIDNKRGESELTPRLTTLVKRVVELHDVGIWACHYAEEFTLWCICPLGSRDKLVYECLWIADPSHELADSNILTLLIVADDLMFLI